MNCKIYGERNCPRNCAQLAIDNAHIQSLPEHLFVINIISEGKSIPKLKPTNAAPITTNGNR